MKLIKNPNLEIELFDDGEMVVYDDETNSTHIFNRTATEFYSLCNQVTFHN